jgi:DNA-binding MarR family transcriptional regulator
MRKHKAIGEIRAFNRFYTNVIGVVDRHILDSPFSLTEVRLLYEIYHGAHVTARKIKQFLQVDEGYLSRTIDKLVDQGMIVRRQSEKDRRLFVLSLSEKGSKEFLALNSRSEAAVDSMIMHLSSGQIDRLVSMMRTIRELLSKEQGDDLNHSRHPNPKRTCAR